MRRVARAVCLALVAGLSGCVEGDDFIDASGHGDSMGNTSSIGATGSRYVRPPDDYRDHPFGGQPFTLTLVPRPPLPAEKLAQLVRWMTCEELIALLGLPLRQSTEVQDVDTGGADWNAEVYYWQYQDPRFDGVIVTRDLDVYLAQVDAQRPLSERPEIVGPRWVVVRWELN